MSDYFYDGRIHYVVGPDVDEEFRRFVLPAIETWVEDGRGLSA